MAAPRDQLPHRVTITVPRWVASMRDPGIQSVVVLAALAVVGFVMAALSWRGAARTIYVPLQVPWLVSGGLAGLALVGLALGAWSIHLGRRDDAAHRAEMDDLVRAGAGWAEQVARMPDLSASSREDLSSRS